MEKQIIALGPKGRKSYIVTLPIDWVRTQKLDKTRKADVSIAGNTIVVRPFLQEPKRVTLNAKTLPTLLRRTIQILYKKGVDEIKILYPTPALIADISAVIEQRCIGYELIDQQKDYCIIKDVTKEAVENFATVLRRIFLLVLQLSQAKKEEFVNLDKSLNKLSGYALRLLAKQGHTEFDKVMYYARLCSTIEHIGDDYGTAHATKQPVSPACTRLLQQTYELFYAFSDKKFEEAGTLLRQTRHRSDIEGIILRRIGTLLGIIYALRAIPSE